MNLKHVAFALAFCAAGVSAQQTVKHIQTDKSPIATGVWAGDTYYLSGQLSDPVTPADPVKKTPAVYPETTQAQSASVFAKIQKLLQDQGLDMKDVVKMTVFLGPDPKTGKLDFAGHAGRVFEVFRDEGAAEQGGSFGLPGRGACGSVGAGGD